MVLPISPLDILDEFRQHLQDRRCLQAGKPLSTLVKRSKADPPPECPKWKREKPMEKSHGGGDGDGVKTSGSQASSSKHSGESLLLG